ncbi:cation:proton antiporter [Stenoxybacter acetivorans]|uniref:cation:proton antiporter domain-containing protein n=1 Tax=Stenoxybacter acetivorans TaxID=422441 RepID=UPI000A0114EB|nr:cation:proton antiporter [Stenoxybacter acetivorans]
MNHAFPLVETIVGGLFFAFILGFLAQKLKMPPLVGYLLAGIVVGPYTAGFTADAKLSQELAELGVILLMFGVGLHFSIRDLLSVKRVAVPGAVIQIGFATLLGLGLGLLVGWHWGAGLVFGLALSCASTVVLIAALDRWHLKDSSRGRIATGWLIVEDIAMVFVLVLIPAMAEVLSGKGTVSGQELLYLVGETTLKIVAFVAVMLLIGRRVIPWSLKKVVRTGSPELFRLGVVAIALGCALLANYLFHVSFALGAFFAGMILSETEMNHTAEEESTGLRDFFTVLFFVSVGMLFDPGIIVREPLLLLATVLIIVVGKSAAAFFIVKWLGYPKNTALTIAVSLAQIGEFSFMIASLGLVYQILPPLASDVILGSALITIILNPFLFMWLNHLRQQQTAQTPAQTTSKSEDGEILLSGKPHAKMAAPIKPVSILFQDEDMVIAPPVSGHAVMVGYGSVARLVLAHLQNVGETVYVQESRLDVATELRARQIPVAYGNALSEGMLGAVYIEEAKYLIITIRNHAEAVAIVQEALKLNPQLAIIVFSSDAEENIALNEAGATYIVDTKFILAEEIIRLFDRIAAKEKPSVQTDERLPETLLETLLETPPETQKTAEI